MHPQAIVHTHCFYTQPPLTMVLGWPSHTVHLSLPLLGMHRASPHTPDGTLSHLLSVSLPPKFSEGLSVSDLATCFGSLFYFALQIQTSMETSLLVLAPLSSEREAT